ncbi:MAG: TolC family protein [Tannerellaceae bacterium]|jgi:outer membrane protein TolC|nr:TolC family protein [Tannerellaceae bacterium]
MKHVMIFLMLFGAFHSWPHAQTADIERSVTVARSVTVTVMECYEAAREVYPLVRRYDLIARTEGFDVSNAAKGFLPQVAIGARATYQSEVTSLPIDASLIPGLTIPTVSKGQYQVSAELTQTVWDGGLTASGMALAHAKADVERRGLESELYALRERVNGVYFGCLLYDELIRQNDLLKRELGVSLRRVEAMMDSGLAGAPDREAVEVEILKAGQREAELIAVRRAYLAVLCVLTGRDAGDTLVLTVPVMPAASLVYDVRRPELSAFDALDAMADVEGRISYAALMPRLGLFVQGGYGRPGLNMLDDSFRPFYMAGVRLSWKLPYTYSNDRRRIEASRQVTAARRDAFLFNTSLDIVMRSAGIEKIRKQLDSDDDILRLRSSIRQAAEVRLENGVISASDLVGFINAEDIARQSAATRRIQLLEAIYDLMYVTDNDQ